MTRVAPITKRLLAKVGTVSILALIALPTALAQVVLYGGLGGHGVSSGPQASTNDGALVIVNQTDGSTTVVGHPEGVARISGLAVGLDGTLFGATQSGGGYPPPPGPITSSNLIRIDPNTGALISSVPIIAGTAPLFIADLALHPTTGVLYGTGGLARTETVRDTGSGAIYTIDTTTGAATLVGTTGKFFASIAFAPDGTFYMSSADLLNDNRVNPLLMTLDPRNAAVLTQLTLYEFLHSLAVRPTDGAIFGGTADKQGVYIVDPATGAAGLIGLTGLNFVGDLAFRPVAAPPAALDLNQHGLTGSWYEPATSGQGVEVEVFPNLAGPGTGVVQVSWFTYDASVIGGPERQRWYTLGGNAATGAASATLAIYQNIGGNFNAAPITHPTQVGTATLSFTTCDKGVLDYTFTDGSGRSGSIELARLTKIMTCVVTGARPVNADFAFSGNWYDPATDGQGITVEINPLTPVAFLAWYTYAPAGAAAGAAGQRWYTGQSVYDAGARTVPMTLYETTGGLFDAQTTPPPASREVGTATLIFQSCSAATLDYIFTGGSSVSAAGRIVLRRVGPVPPGCAM